MTLAGGSGQIIELTGGSILLKGHLDTMAVTGGIRPLRIPTRYWSHFPPAGEILRADASNASGVRFHVRTAATRLELKVRCGQVHFEDLVGPLNHFVAQVDDITVATDVASVDRIDRLTMSGDSTTVTTIRDSSLIEFTSLPSGEKTVTIFLPQGMTIDLLSIAADAPVTAAEPLGLPLWVHYGSSISHCADPELPTSVWPVVAAQRAQLDVVNLGFGGQCMLDPFVADAIAATPADVISLKIGVNIVGARSMDQRTFVPALHGFLDRIRQGHPETPIILASSILWPGSEDVPGPPDLEFFADGSYRCFAAGPAADVAKGALTLSRSRVHLSDSVNIRRAEGENISYLDGLLLYGPDDQESFVLPDSLHPDTALYEEMGRRFAELAFGSDGLVPRDSLAG